MICGCAALAKAIDAFIAKADDDLENALDDAGFSQPKETVRDIGALEEKLVTPLIAETAYLSSELQTAVDLNSFADDWPDIKAGDKTDEALARVFRDEFQTQMPNLASAYIKRIDPELTVSAITRRTVAWAKSWSAELGAKMKLTVHDELERLLVKHLSDGKSVADLTRAFMTSGVRDEYFRARRAAITEMLRAHSVAQQESIVQNPAVEQKEWVHTGSYRNEPRRNHVALSGVLAPKDQPFTLFGADGGIYYPMYPRDSVLPPGESVNCHCIHRGIADENVLGLSIEQRRQLQQKAIAEDDGKWEKELDAKNKAKAGIAEKPDTNSLFTTDAERRYNKAVSAEPEITAVIQSTSSRVGASVEGLDYRIKSEASYTRKVAANPSADIRDVIRYTYTASAEKYTDMIGASMKSLATQGYETVVVKNYWLKPDNPYNGVNTFVRSPAGQEFELQYHTPESFALKNGKLHELYEQQRILPESETAEYSRLNLEMKKLSESLAVPEGIAEVQSYGS